jgi:8-oxo-dGTP pyrophosphatase MutT (NUDIX family)
MRVVSSRVVYENRWMRVHEDRTQHPDGSPGLYGWVEKPPSAIIVPIDGDHVWLIEQYRHPVKQRYWEFPQGAHEDATLSPEALARAELAEETGLRPARMEHLGVLHFAHGLCNQAADIWRATGLEPGEQSLEHTEQDLVVGRFTVDEVERMVRETQIRDAASVAAWHLATR